MERAHSPVRKRKEKTSSFRCWSCENTMWWDLLRCCISCSSVSQKVGRHYAMYLKENLVGDQKEKVEGRFRTLLKLITRIKHAISVTTTKEEREKKSSRVLLLLLLYIIIFCLWSTLYICIYISLYIYTYIFIYIYFLFYVIHICVIYSSYFSSLVF